MSDSSEKVLKVACVGAGSITREFSLRHLSDCPSVEVVAIIDINLDAAQNLATDVRYRKAGANIIGTKYCETVDRSTVSVPVEDLPAVAVAASLEEVLPLCDIVYVGTPPLSHAAITIAALAAKKHVILEKPLAISLDDCTAIVEAAEAAFRDHQLIVNVNIGMRHNAALHEMKRLIQRESFGDIVDISLRNLFMQWPRVWQNQHWVAQRAQGGPLEEVGTHWLFGIMELFGHDSYRGVECVISYPDGSTGDLCESHCSGVLNLSCNGSGRVVNVKIDSTSDEARAAGKDIYELEVVGSSGEAYTLYDFTKLRDQNGNDILASKVVCTEDGTAPGTYGRMECIVELVKAVRGDVAGANLVSPAQARNAQIIIDAMKTSTGN